MTTRRYLVLLAIVFSAAIGDVLLSVGMKQIGAISRGDGSLCFLPYGILLSRSEFFAFWSSSVLI